jgi:hypothetical protein
MFFSFEQLVHHINPSHYLCHIQIGIPSTDIPNLYKSIAVGTRWDWWKAPTWSSRAWIKPAYSGHKVHPFTDRYSQENLDPSIPGHSISLVVFPSHLHNMVLTDPMPDACTLGLAEKLDISELGHIVKVALKIVPVVT